ncbi:hypothetical protein GCM10022255_096570 [Dactylosporangium darangshiense]|uniref:Uncharacterized protein n=1 Tax=Dactylosporangium darangshiense TaxID=579108 RepID=A0ABP8DQP0_9ACTN
MPALRKTFKEVNKTDPRFADWWQENSKEAYNTGLANAAAAFDNYAKSNNGKRRGARMGMPRRKSKHRANRARECRNRVEPTRRPAPPARPARTRRGGQVGAKPTHSRTETRDLHWDTTTQLGLW